MFVPSFDTLRSSVLDSLLKVIGPFVPPFQVFFVVRLASLVVRTDLLFFRVATMILSPFSTNALVALRFLPLTNREDC